MQRIEAGSVPSSDAGEQLDDEVLCFVSTRKRTLRSEQNHTHTHTLHALFWWIVIETSAKNQFKFLGFNWLIMWVDDMLIDFDCSFLSVLWSIWVFTTKHSTKD